MIIRIFTVSKKYKALNVRHLVKKAEQKRKSITICNIKLFKFAIIWILNWITVNCFKDKLCVFSLCFPFNCTPYIIQKSKREIFADVETWTDTTTGEEKKINKIFLCLKNYNKFSSDTHINAWPKNITISQNHTCS